MGIVKDYMLRSLNSVTEDDSIADTIRLMCKREMAVLPVVDDDNKFIGSIYSQNILKNILPEQYGFMDTHKILYEINQAAETLGEIKDRKVKDYMLSNTKTIKEKDSMDKVSNLMLKNEESYIFVINDKGDLRGYISRADLLLYLLNVSENKDHV
ncbi:MAG: CBS domain-containing protein [Bacillota bacterium]